MDKVWLLTTGTGQDGDEWNVEGIHGTEEKAIQAKARYQEMHTRPDGSTYILDCEIEEWEVD